jgi:hypothetical protein
MDQDGNLHMLFVFKMTQRIKVLVRHSIPHSINQSMIIVVFESIILCISNSIQLKPNYIKTDEEQLLWRTTRIDQPEGTITMDITAIHLWPPCISKEENIKVQKKIITAFRCNS